MKRDAAFVLLLVGLTLSTGFAITRVLHRRPATRKTPARIKQIKLNLDEAKAIKLPRTVGLTPVSFTTTDGKSGWVLKIPGDRPIATPAYANGRIFLGGGYGSHEFYAFDADSGKLAWQIKTKDDGPSAAVVENGCVAVNTESCTVYVLDAQTGKILWEEWLGDPLMSQPAIWNNRLYMAYPAGGRGGQQQNAAPGQDQKESAGMSHRLLCADLHTGRHQWVKPISGDVISAPVIEDSKVFLSCLDGSSYCFDAISGNQIWKKQGKATTAPVVAGGNVVMSEKEERAGKSYEGLKRFSPTKGESRDKQSLAQGKADYFNAASGESVGLTKAAQAPLDSSVGFGGGAPASAGLEKAKSHLNVGTVAGAWAYQGSRAAFKDGKLMNAQGRRVNMVEAKGGVLKWQAEATGKGVSDSAQLFSPPSLGAKKMYLTTAQGHVAAVGQDDGKIGFLYSTSHSIPFQPALARGNVYAGTADGLVFCIKTSDRDADGWTAWGGNAQHNKK